jgi:GNAT superfamily N-acetyltransferase
MAFCTTRSQFAIGWLTGGNQRRFENLATMSPNPMGILASMAGESVGWCACGPRSRYALSTGPQSTIMRNRVRVEDETVWLLPCLFVREGYRGQGITYALISAAVELARTAGAIAIEGWPLAGSGSDAAERFLGREPMFDRLGFAPVDRPVPGRVIMRRELIAD